MDDYVASVSTTEVTMFVSCAVFVLPCSCWQSLARSSGPQRKQVFVLVVSTLHRYTQRVLFIYIMYALAYSFSQKDVTASTFVLWTVWSIQDVFTGSFHLYFYEDVLVFNSDLMYWKCSTQIATPIYFSCV